MVGRLELLELDQEALLAYERAQRIEGLHRIGPLGRKVGVGQWRHAEIGEDGLDGCGAESADGLGHGDTAAYWSVPI